MRKPPPYTLDALERSALFMGLDDEDFENPILFINENGDSKLDIEAMVHRMLCKKRDPKMKHLWAN